MGFEIIWFGLCMTRPILSPRSLTESGAMSLPSSRIFPASGCRKPQISAERVDFHAPFFPTIETISPSRMPKET